MPDPTQNNQNTQDPQTGVPSGDQTTPIVPAFQSADSSATPPMAQTSTQITTPTSTVTVKTEEPKPAEDQGSSAPSDLPPMSSSPKKKFGGGKIIATILGFLVLAGGIAGGVILTQQQQDIRERASSTDSGGLGGSTQDKGCKSDNECGAGKECRGGKCRDKPDGGLGSSSDSTGVGDTGTGAGTGDGAGLGGNVDPDKTCTFDNECGTGGECQGGKCVANDGGGLGSSIDCGGASSGQSCNSGNDCHCQGGDACTTKVCEPNIRISCEQQGRAWCNNVQAGTGKTCCLPGYVCGGTSETSGCVRSTNPPGGTPPPGSSTAQCQNVKAYSETWTLLAAADLSRLKAADKVNFCVAGSSTAGTFDKARFTINGVAQAETTTKRPSSSDFCQLYTIPAGTNSFSVSALIHHATLGWK